MRDTLYRERQLWIGNESVEIRYVNGRFVAGTSALSPGFPCHTSLLTSNSFPLTQIVLTQVHPPPNAHPNAMF